MIINLNSIIKTILPTEIKMDAKSFLELQMRTKTFVNREINNAPIFVFFGFHIFLIIFKVFYFINLGGNIEKKLSQFSNLPLPFSSSFVRLIRTLVIISYFEDPYIVKKINANLK